MRWFTAIAISFGFITVLTYGSGAHIAVRYFNPAFGAWWNEHEFSILVAAATALGMLVAIRSGARLLDDGYPRQRAVAIVLVLDTIALPAITNLCGTVARYGWRGTSGEIRESVERVAGYSAGGILDKILIAAVYFLKVSGFAFVVGLAIFGFVAGLLIAGTQSPVRGTASK